MNNKAKEILDHIYENKQKQSWREFYKIKN